MRLLVVRALQSRASRSRSSIPGAWYGTCKHPTDYKSDVRGSVSRVKTPCEQRLLDQTLQAEQRLPHATEEKAKRIFPCNVDPLRSATLRGIRNARSGLG